MCLCKSCYTCNNLRPLFFLNSMLVFIVHDQLVKEVLCGWMPDALVDFITNIQ